MPFLNVRDIFQITKIKTVVASTPQALPCKLIPIIHLIYCTINRLQHHYVYAYFAVFNVETFNARSLLLLITYTL